LLASRQHSYTCYVSFKAKERLEKTPRTKARG
jgi:hypothetical protein